MSQVQHVVSAVQQDRKRRCLVSRLLAAAEDFSDHGLNIVAAYLG